MNYWGGYVYSWVAGVSEQAGEWAGWWVSRLVCVQAGEWAGWCVCRLVSEQAGECVGWCMCRLVSEQAGEGAGRWVSRLVSEQAGECADEQLLKLWVPNCSCEFARPVQINFPRKSLILKVRKQPPGNISQRGENKIKHFKVKFWLHLAIRLYTAGSAVEFNSTLGR